MADDAMTTGQVSTDQALLAQSLAVVAPRAEALIETFYAQLFAEHPELRAMFPPDMTAQHDRLLKAIIALVTHYSDPATLLPALRAMGTTHARHGVHLGHYAIVGETLLGVVRDYAGDAWNVEFEGAWQRAYEFAAGAMLQASSLVIPAPDQNAA